MMIIYKHKIPLFLKEAIQDESQVVCVKAGRRTGKTYNFVIWLLVKLLANNNTSGLWVDTRHSNLDKYIERYFKPILTSMGIWGQCSYNQQKKILTLNNGSYIDFASAERPENMEGFGYDYAVLNEAGIILKKSGIWDNTIYPMVKQAQTRIIGTPKGKNKFHQLATMFKTYTFTCYDSPFWTEEEIERAKTEMPQEVFRQEMLAEFIDGDGSVFRNIQQCIGGELLSKPKDNATYFMAVDLAKHSDFTVITIGDYESKQLVYFDRFNQIDWGLQKTRIKDIYTRFNVHQCVIDATGVGDPIYDDLINNNMNVVPFKFTSSSKQALISGLSVAMDNIMIKFPYIATLVNELEIFGYEQRRDGSFRYSAPEGYHDDCVISLALLNHAFKQGGGSATVEDIEFF